MRLSVQSRSLLLICGFMPADIATKHRLRQERVESVDAAFGGRPKARGHIPNAAAASAAPAIACPRTGPRQDPASTGPRRAQQPARDGGLKPQIRSHGWVMEPASRSPAALWLVHVDRAGCARGPARSRDRRSGQPRRGASSASLNVAWPTTMIGTRPGLSQVSTAEAGTGTTGKLLSVVGAGCSARVGVVKGPSVDLRPPVVGYDRASLSPACPTTMKGGRYCFEPKLDGWRCLAFHRLGGRVQAAVAPTETPDGVLPAGRRCGARPGPRGAACWTANWWCTAGGWGDSPAALQLTYSQRRLSVAALGVVRGVRRADAGWSGPARPALPQAAQAAAGGPGRPKPHRRWR